MDTPFPFVNYIITSEVAVNCYPVNACQTTHLILFEPLISKFALDPKCTGWWLGCDEEIVLLAVC